MIADIFQTPKGKLRPIDKIMDELKSIQRNKAIFKELFNERDRKAIANFMMKAKSLERVPPEDYEKRIMSSAKDALVYMLRRKGTHETFQARTVRGSLYHMMARLLSNAPGTSGATKFVQGRKASKYAKGWLPHAKPREPYAPYTGASMAQEYADEENR